MPRKSLALILLLALGISTIASPYYRIPHVLEASALASNIDGVATNGCQACASLTIALPVSQDDLVVIQAAMNPLSGPPCRTIGTATCRLVSVISNSGQTFSNRFTEQTVLSSNDNIWVWEYYAIENDVSSTTTSITATVSAASAWTVIGYSISGVNLTKPFDPSSSFATGMVFNGDNIPGIAQDFNDCNAVDGCQLTFSTTNPNDLIILGIASQGNPTVRPPPAYTLLGQATSQSWLQEAASYEIVNAVQNDTLTGNWTLTPGESAQWWADAIELVGRSEVTTTSNFSSSTNASSSSAPESTSSAVTVTSTITATATSVSTVMITSNAPTSAALPITSSTDLQQAPPAVGSNTVTTILVGSMAAIVLGVAVTNILWRRRASR